MVEINTGIEKSPFVDLVTNLNQSVEEAQVNWNLSDPEQRPFVFQDWCLLGQQMITAQMKTPTDQINSLRELSKNFLPTDFMPQEAQEEKKNQQEQSITDAINFKHILIVNQIIDLLANYLKQKVELDQIIDNTQVWIQESEAVIAKTNLQMKQSLQELTKKGLPMTHPYLQKMQQFNSPDQTGINNFYEENLVKNQTEFFAKQEQIEKSIQLLMVGTTGQKEAKVKNYIVQNQFEEKGIRMEIFNPMMFKAPQPTSDVYETREIEIFFFEKWGETASSFKYESLDTRIESMTAHCCSTRGIQGLTVILETQEESEVLGKGGQEQGFTRSANIPIGLKGIRVRLADGYGTGDNLKAIQFQGESETTELKSQQGGVWKHFELEQDEIIVGVYGETYDNWVNRLKRLGLIIGKLQ